MLLLLFHLPSRKCSVQNYTKNKKYSCLLWAVRNTKHEDTMYQVCIKKHFLHICKLFSGGRRSFLALPVVGSQEPRPYATAHV